MITKYTGKDGTIYWGTIYEFNPHSDYLTLFISGVKKELSFSGAQEIITEREWCIKHYTAVESKRDEIERAKQYLRIARAYKWKQPSRDNGEWVECSQELQEWEKD
jgi:hypothetical protein